MQDRKYEEMHFSSVHIDKHEDRFEILQRTYIELLEKLSKYSDFEHIRRAFVLSFVVYTLKQCLLSHSISKCIVCFNTWCLYLCCNSVCAISPF